MYHPWRALRALPDWTLITASLPGRRLADLHWPTRLLVMDSRLRQAERRSVLAHELVHIERGPSGAAWVAREEAAVDREAARRLIPIRELGEALAWTQDVHELAEELWTTPHMVRVRLGHLHPSERHYLRRRLQHDD